MTGQSPSRPAKHSANFPDSSVGYSEANPSLNDGVVSLHIAQPFKQLPRGELSDAVTGRRPFGTLKLAAPLAEILAPLPARLRMPARYIAR